MPLTPQYSCSGKVVLFLKYVLAVKQEVNDIKPRPMADKRVKEEIGNKTWLSFKHSSVLLIATQTWPHTFVLQMVQGIKKVYTFSSPFMPLPFPYIRLNYFFYS